MTEFTARGPIWESTPDPPPPKHIQVTHRPSTAKGHYSRWVKGPTSFGPVARLVITAFLVSWVVTGFFVSFIVYWIAEVVVAAALLRDIWKPTWVVAPPGLDDSFPSIPPDQLEVPASTASSAGDGANRVPQREVPLPVERQSIPARTWIAWAILVILLGVVGVVYSSGSNTTKGIIGITASLTALVLLFRSVTRF